MRLEHVVMVGIWLIFILLCVYTFLSWKNEEFEKHTSTIRKSWYLIFVLGCLIFLTKEPATIFTDWKNYVIVLVAFIVIDSLLFLNLYVSKLGGQELNSAKFQVGVTQEQLDAAIIKTNHIPNILISFDFPIYNVDKEEYLYQLEQLLKRYGSLENLIIDVIPYGTTEEQEYLLENMGNLRNKVKRFLSQQNSLTSAKDQLALYPFTILDYPYVVQVQTIGENDRVTEVDGNAITTLIIAYNLAVNENINESGDE